jgi:predicted RNA-binding Zn ribbon-like protein
VTLHSDDQSAISEGVVPRSLDPAIPRHPSEFACIDLINSAFTNHLGTGPAIDRLALERWQAWFLERHALTLTARRAVPVEELAALRRCLRAVLERWAGTGCLSARDLRALDGWLRDPALLQRVRDIDGRPKVVLEPVSRDWRWVMAAVAGSAVELIGLDAPQRLKICTNPNCSWMFYDRTLNRSRRFCSTSPCASVVRVRRFRGERMQGRVEPTA